MKRHINNILIILFIVQGVFSFSIGGSVYQVSILKYLKYVIYGLFIIINLNKQSLIKMPIVFAVILIYTFLYCASRDNYEIDLQLFLFRFMNFISPLFLILLPNNIINRRDVHKIINVVTVSSCLFCFIEYLFLQDVFIDFNFTENGGYYRCISFFIGPNNAAVIFFYALIYYLSLLKFDEKSKFFYFCILMLLISIVMTGSKTPILLSLAYVFMFVVLYFFKYKKINIKFVQNICYISCFVIFSFCIYSILVSFDFFTPREFNSLVEDGRFTQILTFNRLIQTSVFFPTYNIFPSPVYDNLYIQLWSDFGLLGLLLLLIGFVSVLVFYHKKITVLHLLFFISWFFLGFTLNSLYAWPLSYAFYFILLKKNSYVDEKK